MKMDLDMKDKNKMEKDMVEELSIIKMEVSMKEIGMIIWCMAKENWPIRVVRLPMMEIGTKINSKASEFSIMKIQLECRVHLTIMISIMLKIIGKNMKEISMMILKK